MKEYTIQELMEASGVPRRTIYFYCQQGILPPPSGAGQAARYTETHLARLKMIPQLRAQGHRLDDIRDLFASEGTTTNPPAPIILETAADYRISERPIGRALTQYDLPMGMTLTVPARLTNQERAKLQHLLAFTVDLFEEVLKYE